MASRLNFILLMLVSRKLKLGFIEAPILKHDEPPELIIVQMDASRLAVASIVN
jgi:hypothetical protein